MKELFRKHWLAIAYGIGGGLLFLAAIAVANSAFTLSENQTVWHRVVSVVPGHSDTVLFEASVVVYKKDGTSLTKRTIRAALTNMPVYPGGYVSVGPSDVSKSGYIVTGVLGGK